jgi:hypothetical protein
MGGGANDAGKETEQADRRLQSEEANVVRSGLQYHGRGADRVLQGRSDLGTLFAPDLEGPTL